MAEPSGHQEHQAEGADKTFTQEQLDTIIADRLARERSKYADYDDLKSKAAKFDAAQEAGKTEIQKLQESNQALLDKMAGMEKQAKITELRGKVSKDTGVPSELLTGEDEESCKAQANAILAFAKGKQYPGVKGNNHESRDSGKKPGEPTDNDYRQLAASMFGRKD